jgi:hypothetical protein
VVRVSFLEFFGFFVGEVLDALVSLEVILHEMNISLFVDPLICVRAESMHVSESIRSTSIRKEDCHLMKSLWAVAPEVPSRISIM